jgi:gliding motility-associated-like protein
MTSLAQSDANVNNVWYFGDGAGLDFNAGAIPDVLEDGELDSFEGCASVSNTDGELLFYASSNTVYRSDHQVMTNGFDINGSESTIQSVIIVPSPADDDTYYLFSLDTDYLLGNYTGLSYSVIDMTQWSGFGAVTEEKNIQLTDEPLFEGLTAVKHANGTDVWVLTQLVDTMTFQAYLVTEDGIEMTPVESYADITDALGWQSAMKVSPDGQKVACVYSGAYKGQVLDFDPFTGILSNAIDLEIDSENVQDWAPYGCEFSPNGERLYVSHLDYGPIVQYDLTSTDIPASRADVGVNNGVSGNAPYASLQLAPNGAIYAACYGEQFISQINLPNELAADCAFQDTSVVFTSKTCKFGLPQFVQKSTVEALFTYTDACKGDTVYFETITTYDSLLWNFGDPVSGDLNFSTDSFAYHVYAEAGTYTVTLEQYVGEIVLDQDEDINIPGPTLSIEYNLQKDTVCTGDQVKLTATTSGDATFLWDNDSDNPERWVTPPGIYWVRADEGLCLSTDTLQLWAGDCAFMSYPNIITPNGDGDNDTFIPINVWYVTDFEIQIYDRWGKEVYNATQYAEGWDGNNLNGKEVADGVYFYMIKYNGIQNDVKTINGSVTVTRVRNR